MLSPGFNSYHPSVNEQAKFDYGDTVRITSPPHRGREATIVGINVLESHRTYTVEFGDGSDAEIEEENISPVNE